MGRGPRTLATLFLAALAASFELSGSADTVARARADAAALYAEHCAACHGKEGHGDGPTAAELKYRPRDFKAGSFAFGNTTEAMVKTILSGIPGEDQARMPPFKGVLTVAEIEAIVDLVRTMMPAEVLPTAAEMTLETRDGPLVARGLLAPFKAGDPPIARGLLVGLPNGFTFEYATDDLRLLAVRRGGFVTRSDWEGRGGRPLTPLGEVVLEPFLSPQWSPFLVREHVNERKLGPVRPLRAKLRSTSTTGGVARIAFDLVDDDGSVRASVSERPLKAVVTGGAGILEDFELTASTPASIGTSIAFASNPALSLPEPPPAAGSKGFMLSANDDPSAAAHGTLQRRLAVATGWWVVRPSDAATIVVRFVLQGGGPVVSWAGPDHDEIDAWVEVGAKPIRVERIAIACGATSIESLDAMAKELAR